MPILYSIYSSTIGYVGLSIEAILPIPQIITNQRTRSCKGFRLSVIASWIGGDMMKMLWFFTATTEIPLGFKICGMFQMCCDLFLGFQYWIYGDGQALMAVKDHGMNMNGFAPGSRTPMKEKNALYD